MSLGQLRAVNHLQQAASLQVSGDTLKVVNLTGHKLISGYPEGRRMWLNIKWYDAANQLIREDGAYGKIGATVGNPSGGPDIEVESILDLDAANTKIYEAHYAITRDWAQTLMAVSATTYGPIVLNYDRITGAAGPTIADLANGLAGDHQDTFHFALNNLVSKDNRIPPYGMSYDIAQKRNALPTPVNQYGAGTPGSTYNYWDDVTLNPPAGADHAHIELLYQGTSWEYIQFLDKANNKQNAFLGQEGVNMLDAWLNAPTAMDPLNRTMVAPMVMATANWGSAGGNQHPSCNIDNPVGDITIQAGDSVNYAGTASDSDGTIASYAWIFDGGSPASSNIEDPGAITYNTAGIFTTTFSATDDAGAACVAATVLVTVTATGGNQVGVSGIEVGYYQTTGKGKNKVTVFVPASSTVFIPVGENVIIRSTVTDSNGPVSGATVSSSITGLEITSITSTPSDATGIAESNWQTDTPNRKGNGGTIPGLYTVTTTNVSGNWDSTETSVTFTLE
ncbi:MAG: PKD domain-containing protein, partial [Gammaproteobacteria bacterium]|nr:PKD domain-containing protein [Gammaproteobacteria bacterium]